MHEFDRVFQRDDVDRLRLVDLVEHRRERGRLAAAGRAGHENQARLFLRDLVKDRRQAECLERSGHVACNFRMTIAEMALLPEDVDAKARFVVQRVAAIAGTAREVIVDQAAIALHECERDLLGLIRRQRVRSADRRRLVSVRRSLPPAADGPRKS